jgi:hypothetical protein
MYIDGTSEARISGVSDAKLNSIKSTLEQAGLVGAQTSRRTGTSGIGPTLFQLAADEVLGTLNMDVWPRCTCRAARVATLAATLTLRLADVRSELHFFAPHTRSAHRWPIVLCRPLSRGVAV